VLIHDLRTDFMPPTKPTNAIFEVFDFLEELKVLRKKHKLVLNSPAKVLIEWDTPETIHSLFSEALLALNSFKDEVKPFLKDTRSSPFDVQHVLGEIELSINELSSQKNQYESLLQVKEGINSEFPSTSIDKITLR